MPSTTTTDDTRATGDGGAGRRIRAERVEVGGRAWGRLEGAHYADAFRVATGTSRTAEHWARRTFAGGSPAVRRTFGLVVWRGVLGLRLTRDDAPDQIVGWPVVVDEPDTVVLRVDGWMLAACLVVEASAGAATVTTLLRYDRRPARAVWGVAGVAHRALMPIVLGRAAGSGGPRAT